MWQHGVLRLLKARRAGVGEVTLASRTFSRASDLASAFRHKAHIKGVTVVSTREDAERALRELDRLKDRAHAWDTETADISLGTKERAQSPVLHGRIVCATCYCGDDADFGSGPKLFVDNDGPARGLLANYFKSYFEEEQYKKVFHNSSFDCHMLQRHGIAMRGFHADTMHMARLYDTSRSSWEGQVRQKSGWVTEPGVAPSPALHERREARQVQPQISLPNLSLQLGAIRSVTLGGKSLGSSVRGGHGGLHTLTLPKHLPKLPPEPYYADIDEKVSAQGYSLKNLAADFGLSGEAPGQFAKLFGTKSTAAEEAHNCPERFAQWVSYATSDAVMTHNLFKHLKEKLEQRLWNSEVHSYSMEDRLRSRTVVAELRSGKATTYGSVQYATGMTLWDLYQRYLRDLGLCLVDMERNGVGVNMSRLQEIEAELGAQVKSCHEEFAEHMSLVQDTDGTLLNPDAKLINCGSAVQLQTLLFGGESCLDKSKEVRVQGQKKRFTIRSLGLQPSPKKSARTVAGRPSANSQVLDELVGSPSKQDPNTVKRQLLGKGFRKEDADRAENALRKLSQVGRIKPVLTGFVKPLQEFGRKACRIHPSWSWDTSTGRLACRTPNLQNLPTVGSKDSIRLRDVFRPVKGQVFIVADYSQLELRVLAHVAKSRSMIEKLSKGGDYHSEVAAEMFPYVLDEINAGRVVVNSDECPGKPSVKEVFGRERSKAKAVNFGIIYGLGPRALAEGLEVGLDEAKDLISAWHRTKPEVQMLIDRIERSGRETQFSVSLLGRQRYLPFISDKAEKNHYSKSMRAAVNFSIQGSAADIVLGAMLQLWQDPWLTKNGFRLVMQVHDEFVLEGPEEYGEEAAARVREIMMHPFREHQPNFKFKVPLLVDVGVGRSFGEAKA